MTHVPLDERHHPPIEFDKVVNVWNTMAGIRENV
jgi:hypothetical protein